MSSLVRKTQFFALLIFYAFLAVARPESTGLEEYNDFIMHFLGYLILFNSCLLAYGGRDKKLMMLVLLFSYSLVLEIIQYFLPYRYFSLLDLLANVLGLYAGLLIGSIIIRVMYRIESETSR